MSEDRSEESQPEEPGHTSGLVVGIQVSDGGGGIGDSKSRPDAT